MTEKSFTSFAELAGALRSVADRIDGLAEARGFIPGLHVSLHVMPTAPNGGGAELDTLDDLAAVMKDAQASPVPVEWPGVQYHVTGVMAGINVLGLARMPSGPESWHAARKESGHLWTKCPDKACQDCRPSGLGVQEMLVLGAIGDGAVSTSELSSKTGLLLGELDKSLTRLVNAGRVVRIDGAWEAINR